MALFSTNNGILANTGRDASAWPVLLLLLAVLVPSGGVIWMMRQAMENERFAVRQRMTDFYQVQLGTARSHAGFYWHKQLEEMDRKTKEELASAWFSRLVTEGLVDTLIVWGAEGEVEYPDHRQRSPKANAELRQLETLGHFSPEWKKIANQLRERLNRYDAQRLSAPQRRFLMRELTEHWPEQFEFATLEAELLAAEFLENPNDSLSEISWQPTSVKDVWSWYSEESKTTVLLRTSTIKQMWNLALAEQRLPKRVTFQVLAPNETSGNEPSITLESSMPGWRLAISSEDDSINGGSERVALFAWTALALIALTLFLTWLVIRSWWEQMRIARLKNDLVATVSHELKTPLSSIRLLVDTLLDQDANASDQAAIRGHAREYLELISQENARLTRLIDNFLTFSRMERGKQAARLEPMDAREVVVQAADAMRKRFDATDDCELVVEANEPALVRGDIDLLVTSVVNLLDNAWKYSGESKRVLLSCQRQGQRVVIAVQDNGIGLSSQATAKIFDRFYQVDQRLSRSQEGCGLGLSIVKYLVEAHGGEVTVASDPGVGSIFSISLPMDTEGNR